MKCCRCLDRPVEVRRNRLESGCLGYSVHTYIHLSRLKFNFNSYCKYLCNYLLYLFIRVQVSKPGCIYKLFEECRQIGRGFSGWECCWDPYTMRCWRRKFRLSYWRNNFWGLQKQIIYIDQSYCSCFMCCCVFC